MKNNIKATILVTSIVCAIIAFIIILNTVIIPNSKYNDAMALMDAGNYVEAMSAFEALGDYKDSVVKIKECNTAILEGRYNDAVALMHAGNYNEAISAFEALGDYKDSVNKIKECDAAILEDKYNTAVSLMDSNVVSAYEELIALSGYKDSAEKASSIYSKYIFEVFRSKKEGDTLLFGSYEQDNNIFNGKEDIEWIVLANEGNRLLVISKYALDIQQYHTEYADVTWETCSLRAWLNNEFLNEAFSYEKKAWIPTVLVSADPTPGINTNPGNATNDKIFLLSAVEAEKYFSSDSNIYGNKTEYARARCEYRLREYGGWWLRSPGLYHTYATCVLDSGEIFVLGFTVNVNSTAVRPAMWIDLDAIQ